MTADPADTKALLAAHRDLQSGGAGHLQPRLEQVADGLYVLHGRDEQGEAPLAELAGRLDAQVERDRALLTAQQRAVFEKHLLGELGEVLRRRRLDAARLVAHMNTLLEGVRTSQGITTRLDWRLREDVPADARDTVALLDRPVASLLPAQREQLLALLSALIDAARQEDPDAGYAEHVAIALDYRSWHTFAVRIRRPGTAAEERLTRRTALSQGEQKVVRYPAAVRGGGSALRLTGGDRAAGAAIRPARRRVPEDRRRDAPDAVRAAGRSGPRLGGDERAAVGGLPDRPAGRDLRGAALPNRARRAALQAPVGRPGAAGGRRVSLPPWLADPGLGPLWAALRQRLERYGPDWRGRLTLTGLDSPTRRALSDLLGWPVLGDRVRVDVADLDERLRTAGGARAVVEAATGRALIDRRSERAIADAAREAPVATAAALLPDAGWVTAWLGDLRRARPDVPAAADAARVLSAVDPDRRIARVDLAASVLGDAHGLDESTLVGGLVLRGLARRFEVEPPVDAAGRREVWRLAGVVGDGVSSTCLALRLPVVSGALAGRFAGGDPIHLTRRDLDRHPLVVPAGTQVLVCENPRVLEAVADTERRIAVVCGAGNPTLVTVAVLRALACCGATLDYHGDFDWPGLGIANRVLALVGARPWSMTAADYTAAAGSSTLPLRGPAVEAGWDDRLTPAMRRIGLAVHEEALLPELLHGWT